MYIPSMTPSHPARRASIGLITKFQCGARGAVFRDTPLASPLVLGRNDPEPGADRPSTWGGTAERLRLGRTWGESTRGGSTEGRIDRYPNF